MSLGEANQLAQVSACFPLQQGGWDGVPGGGGGGGGGPYLPVRYPSAGPADWARLILLVILQQEGWVGLRGERRRVWGLGIDLYSAPHQASQLAQVHLSLPLQQGGWCGVQSLGGAGGGGVWAGEGGGGGGGGFRD